MSVPGTTPSWDTNATNVASPSGGQGTDGFATNDIPSSGVINYLFYWITQWIAWLSTNLGLASKGGANQFQWNAVDVTGNPVAIYKSVSGQTFNTNTATVVTFETSEYDPQSCVSHPSVVGVPGTGWTYTVPAGKGGLFQIDVELVFNALAWVSGDALQVQLIYNGSNVDNGVCLAGVGTSTVGISYARMKQMSAGDTLQIKALYLHSGSGSGIDYGTISIARLVS